MFRAFYDVFPHGTVWQHLARDGNILLVGTKRPLEIDYELLLRKMQQPKVRRDLELSQVHDAVDVLSMFIFGPETLAEFVNGVEPVLDDRTVLDFSMPRYLGSGFGLGLFSGAAGRGPMDISTARALYYYERREDVVPYLKNLGAVDPADLSERIRTREPPTNVELFVPIPENEWNRWPQHAANEGR